MAGNGSQCQCGTAVSPRANLQPLDLPLAAVVQGHPRAEGSKAREHPAGHVRVEHRGLDPGVVRVPGVVCVPAVEQVLAALIEELLPDQPDLVGGLRRKPGVITLAPPYNHHTIY